MKQFVPITDDMLYRMGGPPGPLVPYQYGIVCWRQLADEAKTIAQFAPRMRAETEPLSASPSACLPA
jgi:hypothetical protein